MFCVPQFCFFGSRKLSTYPLLLMSPQTTLTSPSCAGTLWLLHTWMTRMCKHTWPLKLFPIFWFLTSDTQALNQYLYHCTIVLRVEWTNLTPLSLTRRINLTASVANSPVRTPGLHPDGNYFFSLYLWLFCGPPVDGPWPTPKHELFLLTNLHFFNEFFRTT